MLAAGANPGLVAWRLWLPDAAMLNEAKVAMPVAGSAVNVAGDDGVGKQRRAIPPSLVLLLGNALTSAGYKWQIVDQIRPA